MFTGSGSEHELIVGAGASLATVLFSFFVCRLSGQTLVLRPKDLLQMWRMPWYIISGVYEIAIIACKDLVGASKTKSLYRVCGFDTSKHDGLRQARTVLAVAYTTAAPNFIVVGVDAAQSRMLFHQLERSTVPKMTQTLGAKG